MLAEEEGHGGHAGADYADVHFGAAVQGGLVVGGGGGEGTEGEGEGNSPANGCLSCVPEGVWAVALTGGEDQAG